MNTSTAKPRILVVDDNRDAAESLQMLLQLIGHEVDTAYDGEQALEVFAVVRPDVVFLDIGLPGMDGYEVAGRMRAQSAKRQPLLIALTGWGQEEDERRALDAGFDRHLVKPVEYEQLVELLAGASSSQAE